jgi:hypothetical protein
MATRQGQPNYTLKQPTTPTSAADYVQSSINHKVVLSNRAKREREDEAADKRKVKEAKKLLPNAASHARREEGAKASTTSTCKCGKFFITGLMGGGYTHHVCKPVVAPSTAVTTAPHQLGGVDALSHKWKYQRRVYANGAWAASTSPLTTLPGGAQVIASSTVPEAECREGWALPSKQDVTYRPLTAEVESICERMFQFGETQKKDKKSAHETYQAVKLETESIDLPEVSQIKAWFQSRLKLKSSGGKAAKPKSAAAAEYSRLRTLKLEGLRSECSTRGLSTAGNKAALLARLQGEDDAAASDSDDDCDDDDAAYDEFEYNAEDEVYVVGQRVKREFDDGKVYEGKITKSSLGAYTVSYPDGDVDIVHWDDFDEFEGVGFEIVQPLLNKK